jgi:transposase-like protein
MGKAIKYAPEVRERAVRLVREHEREYPSEWAAIASIAGKIGCTAETLRGWVREAAGADHVTRPWRAWNKRN